MNGVVGVAGTSSLFFFFHQCFLVLTEDNQKSKANGVISWRPPPALPCFRCAGQTPRTLWVLALAFYFEALNNGGNCGVLRGTEALVDCNLDWDHYWIISYRLPKKIESPKPNHMITSGWTSAQLELESNLALAKLNLPWSWLSNKAVVIFVLFFSLLNEQICLGCP